MLNSCPDKLSFRIPLPSNQACYDYIKDTDNYENIDNYCEKIELEKNKISPVSQGYLEFLFGNFGLDFGFVTSCWCDTPVIFEDNLL